MGPWPTLLAPRSRVRRFPTCCRAGGHCGPAMSLMWPRSAPTPRRATSNSRSVRRSRAAPPTLTSGSREGRASSDDAGSACEAGSGPPPCPVAKAFPRGSERCSTEPRAAAIGCRSAPTLATPSSLPACGAVLGRRRAWDGGYVSRATIPPCRAAGASCGCVGDCTLPASPRHRTTPRASTSFSRWVRSVGCCGCAPPGLVVAACLPRRLASGLLVADSLPRRLASGPLVAGSLPARRLRRGADSCCGMTPACGDALRGWRGLAVRTHVRPARDSCVLTGLRGLRRRWGGVGRRELRFGSG